MKVKRLIKGMMHSRARIATKLQLARARGALGLEQGSVIDWLGFRMKINDGPNYYSLLKDIAIRGIYHFDSSRDDPRIIDCGSNIGASILYFKHQYPKSRIIGFEADPLVLPYLEENIESNNIRDVQIVKAALSSKKGDVSFFADGMYAGRVTTVGDANEAPPTTVSEVTVSTARLYDYLNEPVDFLKMNIEGAEFEVLSDAASRLRNIDQLVIEYHHLPGLPRTLHEILRLLHSNGFEYLINHFDSETNPACEPPFSLSPETRYFLAVYAKKIQ